MIRVITSCPKQTGPDAWETEYMTHDVKSVFLEKLLRTRSFVGFELRDDEESCTVTIPEPTK